MTKTTVREDFDRYMIPVYSPAPFIPVKGEGSTVYDQQGKEYIDFTGGIAVNVLGHAHPALKRALIDQACQLWHTGNGYTNEPVLKLAKTLVEHTFADRVFFCNSGAEANEAALKLARKYALDHFGPHKNEIVAFSQAFHGRTLFTVSTGGQPKYSQDFAPLPMGIKHVPFNNSKAACEAITDATCAVIVEPIQGEGGVIPAYPEFLQALRQRCDDTGAVLIFDEVQTGVGRSGQLYAYMTYDVEPDVLSTAKGLGGGFPIGGILAREPFASTLTVGTHGTTFGGNPLAASIANQVLEIVNQPGFLFGVRDKSRVMMAWLEKLNREKGLFKEVRGCGLLIGCPLTEHYAGQAKAIRDVAAQHGLMILMAGPDVVRFAPALNISDNELNNGLERFARAIEQFVSTCQ